ncbi:xanthine/uracil permease [Microthyrium microscopicum]|uniref:Xanthine/uracil permease n=1 Tax=Microthyrium microscopicum TaxID=703497 RepID=A0A6A6U0A1_9PEZI|nr:xanthine/uracil permease [Microthyrium microscopicum]
MAQLDPDVIGPDTHPKKNFSYYMRSFKHQWFTKDGLIGDYDYAYLFTPNLPFMGKKNINPPFFGLNDKMPIFLAAILGLQHTLAMLAGVITPSLILSGAGGVNLAPELQQYLVSTSLIVCGLLSSIQITRFHIYKTPYYIGTGLISVVGTSFAIIPVASGAFTQMYANGYCPKDAQGNLLACPKAYGALIGTAALCSLVEIALSFLPPRVLKKVFPPIVTGPTVLLIGVDLIGSSGFKGWAGGSGLCAAANPTAFFAKCPDITAPHALPWGSAQYIGLGFSVFVTILLFERFGSPIMKSASVIGGLLVGCIIAGATGYFDSSGIDSAPAASFIWVHTFPLSVYGPIVLPMMILYVICACEAIGDITATSDVSNLEVEGPLFESRIQGGILADGLNGMLAGLCTITPMSTFAQNNGVIALTRCANRKAGYFCCFFLVVMGIFSKFAAALVAIPAPVLGGMTTFLFCAVAVAGMAIISRAGFSRRNRFILTAALSVGFGAILVPNWFSFVFTYEGDNHALRGFYDAIVLVMETGFAVSAILAMILNLTIDEEYALDATQLEGHPPNHDYENEKSHEAHESADDEIEIEKRHKANHNNGASSSGAPVAP